MKYVLLALLFLISSQLFSQCDGRYETEIFDEVSKTIVEYTDVYDWSALDSGLDMDIYQPVGDTATNRPVLIFAHGGVYVTGNKNNPPMVSLCEAFAKRGYVTASIQYRLTSSLSLLSPNASDIFSQTVLNSVSDMKAAVRYFRKDVAENNNTYGINPDFIFVGGYSAGAVTAAHLSVIDDNQVPAEFQSFYDEAGGIEGNSGNSGYSSEVSGAILLAGAINTLDFIDADDEPIVSLHASDDNTVSYE
ncbi:MAG: carboxylesterase family protein, partial [Flavobacteriales bacterium]